MSPYDFLKVKNPSVKSVYYVTECLICNLIISRVVAASVDVFFCCTYLNLNLKCHFVRNFVLEYCFISGSVISDGVGQITDTRNECSATIFFRFPHSTAGTIITSRSSSSFVT